MKKILIPSSLLIVIAIVVIFIANTNKQTNAGIAQTTPTPTNSTTDTTTSGTNTTTSPTSSAFKDGSYTGDSIPNGYGNVQVEAVVSAGKITDVKFLALPSEAMTSQYINSQASPILKSEAINAQSSQVDIVSGATATSYAFQQSLQSALSKAS